MDKEMADQLKVLEECQKLFTNFLPPCNPCFAASCEKCPSATQESCKASSKEVYSNSTCQTEMTGHVQKFVKAEKKCAFLEPPRKPSGKTRTQKPIRPERSDWMSKVPDDQSLALMTIPGTHQSCARYGGVYSECQTMSITEQLNNGIRFFDIRCRVMGDAYTIHHEMMYQEMVFGGVLDECMEFLNNHPNETILMKIKQEYSKASDYEFIEIFNNYKTKKGYKNVAYGDKMFISYSVPNLKEVRGKIVIISQVAGLPGIQWPSVNVQDDYWVSSIFGISEKFDKVKKHLGTAAQEHSRGNRKLHANFASGASYFAFPYIIARSVNKDLHSHLKNQQCEFGSPCYYGIVALDFPDYYEDGVIDLLIKQNKNK